MSGKSSYNNQKQLNHKQRREQRRKLGIREGRSIHNRDNPEIEPEIRIPNSPTGSDAHHRMPRSQGGDSSDENINTVPIIRHRAYHTLHGNNLPPEVAAELNRNWIAEGWVMIAINYKKKTAPEIAAELNKKLAKDGWAMVAVQLNQQAQENESEVGCKIYNLF